MHVAIFFLDFHYCCPSDQSISKNAKSHTKSSPSASFKSHLMEKEKKRVKEEKAQQKEKKEERRRNYQECSLRDQLHFKEARPRVPCSAQPRVPVL